MDEALKQFLEARERAIQLGSAVPPYVRRAEGFQLKKPDRTDLFRLLDVCLAAANEARERTSKPFFRLSAQRYLQSIENAPMPKHLDSESRTREAATVARAKKFLEDSK